MLKTHLLYLPHPPNVHSLFSLFLCTSKKAPMATARRNREAPTDTPTMTPMGGLAMDFGGDGRGGAGGGRDGGGGGEFSVKDE